MTQKTKSLEKPWGTQAAISPIPRHLEKAEAVAHFRLTVGWPREGVKWEFIASNTRGISDGPCNFELGSIVEDDILTHSLPTLLASLGGCGSPVVKMLSIRSKSASTVTDMCEQMSSLPTDCTLVCKNGNVAAHRLVLCAASSFFMTMITQNISSNHICLPEFDVHDIQLLMDLMYGKSVTVSYDRMNRLAVISQKLGITAFDE
ncbi:BTB domain-containing protein [Trichonephila clavipes]|nr:BTB domain-containing protein [Trichonephila clavipes]